ncbi:unnamed protein product [Ostreobium quekettii]|uniref:Membrane insertase YidC/Oxa/ALB C-terminal domain-containing protein n=1 Tax=Ostreobium quekettii TaxID=121088 RepID=A0A8S1J039_9CHLO|nr:unnamed protein product [Ostreobium quekettii]|eukprot:evm.model.scf_1101.4 EVM.evm.TU.scf_1101.4   scf_1101:19851-24630(+)
MIPIATSLPMVGWHAYGSLGTAASSPASVGVGNEGRHLELDALFVAQSSEASLGGGPVGMAAAALDQLHGAIGMPWWATIPVAAISMRTLLLPLTVKQIQSTASTVHLFKQALQLRRAKAPKMAGGKKQGLQSKEGAWEFVELFHRMRKKTGAPHPAWILASPLIQIPIFVTSVMAVRSMANSEWPGFPEGGVLWFADLTQPAMDFWAASAPLGVLGGVVPIAITLSYLANIDLSFRSGRAAGNVAGPFGSSLVDMLKLFLEWLSIPILVISMQLPHASLLYWLSSSLFSLAQNLVLGHPQVRAQLGMHRHRAEGNVAQGSTAPTTDMHCQALPLFAEAAEWRAKGDMEKALEVLESVKKFSDEHPRAHFAHAELLREMKRWKDAALSYERSVQLETESQQRGRCWFGAGISLYMLGELEKGEAALLRASKLSSRDVRVWMALASIFSKTGRKEEATRALSEAAKLDPSVRQYLQKTQDGQ